MEENNTPRASEQERSAFIPYTVLTNLPITILFAVGSLIAGLGGYGTYHEYVEANACSASDYSHLSAPALHASESQTLLAQESFVQDAVPRDRVIAAECQVDPQTPRVLRDGVGVMAIATGAYVVQGTVMSYSAMLRRRDREKELELKESKLAERERELAERELRLNARERKQLN